MSQTHTGLAVQVQDRLLNLSVKKHGKFTGVLSDPPAPKLLLLPVESGASDRNTQNDLQGPSEDTPLFPSVAGWTGIALTHHSTPNVEARHEV